MARLKQPEAFRNGPGGHGPSRAVERANRYRSWPRWVAPALRFAMLGTVLAGIGGGSFWLWRTGLAQGIFDTVANSVIQVTAVLGFRVDEVFVEGRSGSDKADLMTAIRLRRGDPILGFSLTRARADLEHLPWIASATIERRLPDLVLIRLTERRPMALWQIDGKVVLIDREGNILADEGVGRFNKLPIIVGKGAPEHAPDLLGRLAAEPVLASHLGAAVWVGGRRWDLRLDNNINVRLPEFDYAGALHHLSEMVTGESLFDRDIVAIDLRLPDRVIVQTSENAAQRHKSPGEKI
jgi:cell division protein FtsQ